MTDAPDVSVVIATRNRRALAAQAVTSALLQEGVHHEVVVVDDASQDGTADALLALGDERLRLRARERPGGAGQARNDGARFARAPWIAFLDDDDLFAPNRLRVQLDAMGDAAFGWCGQVLVDEARTPLGTLPAPTPDGLAERLRNGSLIGGPSGVIVRTDVFAAVGGFSGRFVALDDWHLWLRLASRGPAVAVPDLLVAYTVHSSNMHLRDPWVVVRDFDRFVAHHGVHDAGPAFFAWIAEDNHRAGNAWAAAKLHMLSAWRYRRAGDAARAARALVRRRQDRVIPLAGPPWLEPYRTRRS